MAPQALAPAGGSLPHNNMMPFLTLNFAIALQASSRRAPERPSPGAAREPARGPASADRGGLAFELLVYAGYA
jgi:hypothetical protein